MKWRDPSFWLSGLVLVLVIALALWDSWRSSSPGPLSAPHAIVSELAGVEGCDRCHGSGGALAPACVACHIEVGEQLASAGGLHGKTADAERCQLCHSEHHGVEFAILSDASFLLAGVSDRESYPHDHVDFGLIGRHTELECSECHVNANAEVVPRGEHRFLGLDQACDSCHDDPHEGLFDRNCAQCHGQDQPFDAVASFVHMEEFPLTGAHGASSCRDCHAVSSTHSLEALARVDAPPARTCSGCHESPHRAEFIERVAVELALEEGLTCRHCHPTTEAGFSQELSHAPPELHAAAFSLAAPHADVACGDCHVSGIVNRDLPAREPLDCAACHRDPHGGQFRAGARCIDCHSRRTFEPHLFGIDAHAKAALPLTGAHVELKCSDCHERPIPEEPRRFVGLSAACRDCHADVHASAFEEESCAACHLTEHFSPTRTDAFKHGEATGFVLEGAHGSIECSACHTRSEASDAERSLGRIADLIAGPPTRCDSCHDDYHEGRFDLGLAEGESCERCHATTSFRDVDVADFDHDRWTGFLLEGAHARAACADCHQPASSAAGSQARFTRVANDCASCHKDPHGGAFGSSCATCHEPNRFRPTSTGFDHARWTGFELDGAHEEASCEACHPPLLHPSPTGRPFASAVGSRCEACHDDSHAGQFAVSSETDCARCHATDRAFVEHLFDHDDAGFVLDERHRELDCSQCHRESKLRNGSTTIRYKPLGTLCSDCHGQGPIPGGEGGRR